MGKLSLYVKPAICLSIYQSIYLSVRLTQTFSQAGIDQTLRSFQLEQAVLSGKPCYRVVMKLANFAFKMPANTLLIQVGRVRGGCTFSFKTVDRGFSKLLEQKEITLEKECHNMEKKNE